MDQDRSEGLLKTSAPRPTMWSMNHKHASSDKTGWKMSHQHHGSSALDRLVVGANRSFDLNTLLQDTARTLSNLDFEYRHEVQRLENSRTDPTLKKQIAESLMSRHRERRQPYVMLVAELRKHLSAATDTLRAAG